MLKNLKNTGNRIVSFKDPKHDGGCCSLVVGLKYLTMSPGRAGLLLADLEVLYANRCLGARRQPTPGFLRAGLARLMYCLICVRPCYVPASGDSLE